jgi:hypothetical protein
MRGTGYFAGSERFLQILESFVFFVFSDPLSSIVSFRNALIV